MSARAREEGGFTIVEALVAAILVTLTALALLAAFDGSSRATFRAEQSQVASDIAQRELEALRGADYDELALSGIPAASADPNDPRSRISGSSFALNEDGTDPATMVVDGASGVVNAGPEPFESGDIAGTIQRYVVWRDDPNCTEQLCPGTEDFKRIVVAVSLDPTGSGGERGYVELQSDVIDPEDSVSSNPNLPDLGDPTIAQQFWLSDERCMSDYEPAPTSALTSHPATNTFGGNCEEDNEQRPDALVTTAPVKLPLTDPERPDYATDIEPDPPDSDSGLQFALPTTSDCAVRPGGADGGRYKESHVWVSRTVDVEGGYRLLGGATLELWTRTINDVAISGQGLCITLFMRTDAAGVGEEPIDVPIAAVEPVQQFWPQNRWQSLRIPMSIPAEYESVPEGDRIGISIGLKGDQAGSNQIMVNYDSLDLESRLEVETDTPMEPPAPVAP